MLEVSTLKGHGEALLARTECRVGGVGIIREEISMVWRDCKQDLINKLHRTKHSQYT